MIKLLTVLGLLLANPILGQTPQNVRIGGKKVKIGEKTWLLRDATPAAAYVPVTAEMMKAGFWKYFVLAYNRYGYLKRGYEHKDRFPERDSFPVCLQNGYIVHNLLQGETATPASDYPHLHRIEGAPLRSVIMQNGNKQENIAEENIQYSINEILCDNTSGIWLMKSVYNVMIQAMDPAGITVNPVTVVREQGQTEDASLKKENAKLKEENDRLKKELEDALNVDNNDDDIEVTAVAGTSTEIKGGSAELSRKRAEDQRLLNAGGKAVKISDKLTFYYFFELRGSREVISSLCKAFGFELATILSKTEFNHLKFHLPTPKSNDYFHYLTDGYRQGNDPTKGWKWATNNQKIDFSFGSYWLDTESQRVLSLFMSDRYGGQFGLNDCDVNAADFIPFCEKREN